MSTTLVMLSGGLDSTYLLWHVLQNTRGPVHAHHISLRTPNEPRWAEEDAATLKVVEWCRRELRPFDLTESRFDISFTRYVGRDSDLQLLVAAKVAPNLQGAVRVALGWQKDDLDNALFRERFNRGLTQAVWQSLCESMDGEWGRGVHRALWFPLIDAGIGKTEMLERLPPELLAVTWSCRSPLKSDFGLSSPCGVCAPCRGLKRARQRLLEPE